MRRYKRCEWGEEAMMTKRDRETDPAWLPRCTALILAAVLTAGCTTVNHLREAQDAFNQGAAAENAQRLAGSPPKDALAGLTAVRTSYASALLSLDKLSDSDEKSLRADGLWGTALTLKALCQWRLGFYDKALAVAAEATGIVPEQIYPRDQALLLALPGLVKTDQAYDKILRKQSFDEVKELLVGSRGAVANFQSARGAVGRDHPLQSYLIQAQLAAYRNYMMAVDTFQNHATVPFNDPARGQAQTQLQELNELLKQSSDDAQRKALVQYWTRLCALETPS
jgi:tetratricopeptide (TPR) repeat protein